MAATNYFGDKITETKTGERSFLVFLILNTLAPLVFRFINNADKQKDRNNKKDTESKSKSNGKLMKQHIELYDNNTILELTINTKKVFDNGLSWLLRRKIWTKLIT